MMVSGEEMQEVDKFISTDGGMGEEMAHRVLREEWFGDNGKVVEGEYNIQRGKTGAI